MFGSRRAMCTSNVHSKKCAVEQKFCFACKCCLEMLSELVCLHWYRQIWFCVHSECAGRHFDFNKICILV